MGVFVIAGMRTVSHSQSEKICWWTPKVRKSILNHLLKVQNYKITIEISQFMLNLYLKMCLTSIKNKLQQKQLALYKSYASAQSGNPDQS